MVLAPDLDRRVVDKGIDEFALVGVSDREHLVVDRHHAVGSDPPQDPLAALVLFAEHGNRRRVLRGRHESETIGRHRHLESLVRSLLVVVVDPCIQLFLRELERCERAVDEELFSHALMEAFDLAGGCRRARCGELVGDPVLPAHAIEHDLSFVRAEATGEDLAVVGQHLVGDPVAQHRDLEDVAHRSGGCPRHKSCGDAEAAVVIDARDDLEIGTVVQHHSAHDVHLPQLHGAVALPAAELVASLLAAAELDEVVAFETAIDARATWQWIDSFAAELVQDPARSPTGMLTTQLTDQGLQLGCDLVGTALRSM